jgi:hypothetical protein
MYYLRLSFAVISILFFTYGVSAAQTVLLIASDDSCVQGGGSGFSTLYSVDPETASSNPIGPIGFRGVSGIVQLGNGRLVGSAIADTGGDFISVLIEIDPFTGQGSLIGTIGNNNEGGCGRVPDLTYDASTDTLFGTGFRCIPGNNHGNITDLIRINQTTGQGTIIGQTGFFGGGNGIAIMRTGGTLYSTENQNFFSLDPLTGQGTLIAVNPSIEFVISAMDFSPLNGELYGIEFGFVEDPTYLVTVNTTTAVLTRIGQLPVCSDALAFFVPFERNVPTLSEWGMIAAAVGLGLAGVWFALKRRKAQIV